MGVYVKGMEMPTNCPCELTGVGYDLCCSFVYGIPKRVKEYYECCENGTRPDWCPLIPVPPHGRLIDADAVFNNLERTGWYNNADRDIAEDLVLDAPTVIDAEEAIA